MNHWLAQADRPLIIGHRGASAHAPENTLAAFMLALEQGADGVELDVTRCATGELVVIHDDRVDRTTNGRGWVHKLSLAELRGLDAGRGERIPTLDEVIVATAAAPRPCLLNIEIKSVAISSDGLERQVVEVVRRHACEDRVLFSSFNPLTVRRLAQLAPDIPRAILYYHAMPIYLRRVWTASLIPHEFRHPDVGLITPAYVTKLKAQGKRVNTWTVNRRDDVIRVAESGVHGIIGDSPRLIREALGI
ncbi:MAG: hypothetical protein NZM18_00010 [Thermoflexales bacterium]|nr:hypothetical protein [Thermoflexales bacterium]